MKKTTKQIAFTALLLIGIGVIFGFSRQKKKATNCWSFEIEVDHTDGHFFVDESSIRQQLAESGQSILGASLTDIDLGAIKKIVESESAVESAEVYITADGKLRASITQRNPILRILNSDGSGFYLDENGETFPLSQNYTAHITVATGKLTEPFGKSVRQIRKDSRLAKKSKLDDLYELAMVVHADEFWSAQIDHFVINDKKDIEIIPRVGNHRIVFGDATEVEAKLAKLKKFYEKTIGTYDLNQYKTINLKYQDQVVCTRW